MENDTEYHICECGNTYIAGPKRLVDTRTPFEVIRDSQRERRRYALLQAAATIFADSAWERGIQAAVTTAHEILSEIEVIERREGK